MVRRLLLTAALLGVALAAPAAARAQSALRWQFKAGEKFYVEEVVKADQNVTVTDMKLNQKTTTRRVSQFTVKTANAKGFQLEQKILTWSARQEGGAAPPDDGKLDKLVRGATFQVHLAPNGVVTRFEGYEDFLKKIGEQDATEAKLFRMILTEEAIRSPLEMIFSVVPDKDVKEGDQWQHKLKVPTGPMGTFLYDVDYTYRGKKGDLVEIAARGKFEYQPPRKDVEGAPFTIRKADLKSPGSTGTVTFDVKAGRLVDYTMETPISGTLTLEVMMNELAMGLDGTETRTIRLLARNPAMD